MKIAEARNWLKWFGCAALMYLLGRFGNKIFRAAFVTVLVVGAIQQFVGWKYVGVVVREAVVRVQDEILPWEEPTGINRLIVKPQKNVATLLIGDEFFADADGFAHRVPLPPSAVLRLLQAIAETVPAHARVAIDFDLAPRVGEEIGPRRDLDNWLEAHAERLLLVEPGWAARHAQTFGRQIEWMSRMCGVGSARSLTTSPRSAVFVQSTLMSRFGVVVDSLPLSGERGPAWDFGRAVFDHVSNGGQKRNPLCARLRPPEFAKTAGGSQDVMSQAIALQLTIAKEIQLHGTLLIEPQSVSKRGHAAEVSLRSEYIQEFPGCSPKDFDEVAHLPCLRQADVVLVGGSWSFGQGDRHETFRGEVDGVLVHAAWIQSWLQPTRPLNEFIVLILEVLIIESLLHPLLEFAFRRMRSESDEARVGDDKPRPDLGRHVTYTLLYMAFAVLAVAGTTFALISVDGLLRWTFGVSLALDTTILALLTWSVLAFGSDLISKREEVHGAWHSALWLASICLIAYATVLGAWWLSSVRPAWVPYTVCIFPAVALFAFVVTRWRSRAMVLGADPNADGSLLTKAWQDFRNHRVALHDSLLSSLDAPRVAKSDKLSDRLADFVGALLWIGIWGYGLVVLVRSTLWSLFLELLGG